jgi:hypothetical protein
MRHLGTPPLPPQCRQTTALVGLIRKRELYDEGRHCEVFLTNRFKSGDEMLTPATCRLLLILLVQRSVFLVKEMPWQD